MLFPFVYDLGYRAGQSVHHILHHIQNDDSDTTTQTCSDMISKVWFLFPTGQDAMEFIRTSPLVYKEWWWNLVHKDPLHVGVETTLLVVIVYLIVSRSSEGFIGNPREGGKNAKKEQLKKLSLAEEEELLLEWKEKTRAPLAPIQLLRRDYSSTDDNTTVITTSSNGSSHHHHDSPMMAGGHPNSFTSWTNNNNSGSHNNNNNNNGSHPPEVLVHKQHGRTMEISICNNGHHQHDSDEDNHQQQNTLLSVLNFATFDFLGVQTNHENSVKAVSEEALKKYGCGSCGPRGFYGTIDTHLQLEAEISKFTRTEGAIMYSDGASTCSSTVAAFAKRGDLLIVDEGCYEPLVTGVMLSRANVKWFKHNDMEDLERVLQQVQQTDLELKRPANAQRRFIVVEGLYKNLGSLCPMDQVVALKHKYHYRLILDESFSFGTMGPTGRGILELYGLRPMYDAEIVTIGLEHALGSIGGVTVGNEEVVDHQRLSGAGYCFSAAAPPFVASAAVQTLQLLQQQEEQQQQQQQNLLQQQSSNIVVGKKPRLLKQLHANIAYLNAKLRQALENQHKNTKAGTIETIDLMVTSDEKSPIIVLQLEDAVHDEATILCEIVRACLYKGVAVVATGQDTVANGHLRTELAPAIRMTVSSLHTTPDMDQAVQVLLQSARSVMVRYSSCHRRSTSPRPETTTTTTTTTTTSVTPTSHATKNKKSKQ
jgi:serine palmitoyltransferase